MNPKFNDRKPPKNPALRRVHKVVVWTAKMSLFFANNFAERIIEKHFRVYTGFCFLDYSCENPRVKENTRKTNLIAPKKKEDSKSS
jgi:hypothetical protein